MDRVEEARRLRHYGMEMLLLAARLEVDEENAAPAETSRDELGRLRCCGAGPDRRDARTGEDLHLPGCPVIAASGLAACRASLDGRQL